MLTIKRAALLDAIAEPDARPNVLLQQVPRRADFVEYPSSWYLFCVARELDRGPLSKHMLGTDLVAYRTDAGRVVVMSGRCSHMRADLGKGKVVGDCIQCPFHGWRYGPDGHCKHIPRTDKIPQRARQRTYPAVERHGLVFVFNGPEPLFPLPFFLDERVEDFTPATPVEFVANCSWFLVAAHGYDSQHFETVHSRRLHAPLVVDCPAPFARRSRYTADVLGEAYYDRLLRTFAGPTVHISITTWGGTMVLITGKFKRATSQFMISARPIEGGKTLCHVVAFARLARQPVARYVVQPVDLWIRRRFTGAYLLAEVEGLGSPRYTPSNFVEADRDMLEYFCWAATLPKSAYATSRR
jgi:nitrite reductase/ring-hydroxylating ferredoxin subunit